MPYSSVVSDYVAHGSGPPSGVPPVHPSAAPRYYDDIHAQEYVYNWVAAAWQAVGAGGGGGGGFNPFFDTGVLGVTVPAAASFTLNQRSGSLATLSNLNSRGVSLVSPQHTSSYDNIAAAVVPVPSTAAFTATALIQLNANVGSFSWGGLCVVDTATKYEFYVNKTGNLTYEDWTGGIGGYSGDGVFTGSINAPYHGLFWARLRLASGTYTFSISVDGENFDVAGTRSSTAYLTTPAYVGLAVNKNGGSTSDWPQRLNCYSWTLTTP